MHEWTMKLDMDIDMNGKTPKMKEAGEVMATRKKTMAMLISLSKQPMAP